MSRGQRAKQAWARLIRKVYEADPLECPVLAGKRPPYAVAGGVQDHTSVC